MAFRADALLPGPGRELSGSGFPAYGNGQPYGTPYTASSLPLFEAKKSRVLFGLRHSPAGGNRHLIGAIDRAALYSRALTADEVASLAGTVTEKITADELLAAMPHGDDALLRAVLSEHEKAGFRVVGAEQAMSDLLAQPGAWGAVTPNTSQLADITKEFDGQRLNLEVDASGKIIAVRCG